MKMFKKTVAIAALSAGLMGSAHANFVNSGFESGLSGWEANGDVSVVSSYVFNGTTILAPQGSNMALLGGTAGSYNYNILLQGSDATTQRLTLWYRYLGNGGNGVSLDVQSTASIVVGANVIYSGAYLTDSFDTGWQQYLLDVGTTSLAFYQDSLLGNSQVLVDLVAGPSSVPEPATYGMVLGALGIMGAVMRRRSRADRG
jgi:hypothetical protein